MPRRRKPTAGGDDLLDLGATGAVETPPDDPVAQEETDTALEAGRLKFNNSEEAEAWTDFALAAKTNASGSTTIAEDVAHSCDFADRMLLEMRVRAGLG